MDDVFLDRNTLLSHFASNVAQVFVDSGDGDLGVITRQNLVQKVLGDLLGQGTVFSTFHIETLDFHLLNKLPVLLYEVDGSVLLLGLEQYATEDVVDINLEQIVLLVDGFFESVANLECVGNIVHVGVDHDRVSVSIDNLQRIALGELLGAAKNLTTLKSCQNSQRSSVKS
ncbi:hypothetical protein HG530_014127 [Fusarium avenaceum]|nr:hypothetical protein HG530_014127 [Fusarium avenaceum]